MNLRLEVLSSFVQDQENLLRHTEADIELLKELRGRAEAQPEDFHANLSQEVCFTRTACSSIPFVLFNCHIAQPQLAQIKRSA